MEVQVAETGPCSRSLTITVPPDQVQEHLDRMYASASQQIHMKGFRPGKVPRALVQKRFGAGILAEAKEQMLNRFFGEACRQKDLSPVGRIAIDDVEKLEVVPGGPLQFTAKIDVRPQFELKNVKGFEVDAFDGEASEADVDNALKEILHQKRTIQPTTDAAQDGDFVRADYAFVDASGNEVLAKKGVQLNTRNPIRGTEQGAYEQAMLGAKAGDARELPITFPANFEKESLRGQTGTVRLQVHEVLRVTPPPVDDALAQSLEFENVAALRADLAARITQEKQRLGKQRQEEQVLQALLASHDIAVPPSLIEEQQRAALGALAHRMEQDGAQQDVIEKKLEESKGEAQQDALRRVKLFFLIEAVARQHKLFVTENDVEAELRGIALANSDQNHQFTTAQVREHLERENRLGELRLSILERKVRDFLRENAKIVDRKAS
jgi:trigger factor